MIMHILARVVKAISQYICLCSWRLKHSRLQTSRVSLPPTMLSPSPLFPLLISMVVSRPGIIGHEVGSCMTVAAAGVSDERWRLGDDDEKTGVAETVTTGNAARRAGDWWADEAFARPGDTWRWRGGDDVCESDISNLWYADASVTKKLTDNYTVILAF